MIAHELDACTVCPETGGPHQDWHPSIADCRSIGDEMARRQQAKERWEIRSMPDDELVAYGKRLRRQIAMAEQDGLPDFLLALAQQWLVLAAKEWAWRRRAARAAGEPIQRTSNWPERVERVKRETDLAMLIAYECAGARPAGPGQWVCCCPFHDDRHPSMAIDVAKGLWVCFPCRVGGDAITYVELRYRLDFAHAVTHLEQRLGIEAPRPEAIRGIEIVRARGAV